MPNIDFTLPHWAYWLGLIVFPLIAMSLARTQEPGRRRHSKALAYLILVTGGMVGLHRFYLKSLWGLAFIPVFLLILFANGQANDARTAYSDAANLVRMAERTLERETATVAKAEADLPGLRAAVETEEAGSFARRSAEKRVERAEGALAKGQERIAEARTELAAAQPVADAAGAERARWTNVAKFAFWALIAGMVFDAFAIPLLVRWANQNLAPLTAAEIEAQLQRAEEPGQKADEDWVTTGWTGAIDRLCLHAGEFVSYWAVIAVFVYYFEVISRYVFNSPTNWAHEGMYLMFGMQYLIAGAYAMLTESHVRVDIFYAPLKPQPKAWVNLATSVFFFIFAFTLLFTSWIFAFDAIAVPSGNGVVSDWARGDLGFFEMLGSMTWEQFTGDNIRWGEISFNEWEVPLWPMKWVMVIGGLLLVLQGIAKIAQDVATVAKEW